MMALPDQALPADPMVVMGAYPHNMHAYVK